MGIGISRSYRTAGDGRFTAAMLPVGNYELTAELMSFGPVTITGITVTVGNTRFVEAVMKPAVSSTTIKVVDKPSLARPFQFETSTLFDNVQVHALPLNGRRFLDLALLAPGILQEKERGQLSLSGARGINSAINVDGGDFNQPFFGGQGGGARSNFAFIISQEAPFT